jgi:hypothetical protein
MGTNKKSTWKTVNEGTFAGIKGLGTLDPIERVKVLELAEDGKAAFVGSATTQAIRLGRICALIRKKAGDAAFKQLVERFWLEKGQSYIEEKRHLEICQQMYHFSRRKGLKLPTDIPKDSYLRLSSFIGTLKGKRRKNTAIANLKKERQLNGVEISDSKALRRAVVAAKKAIEDDGLSSEKVFECRVSQAISDFKRVASTLESVTQKTLSSIPKKPHDPKSVSSRLSELRAELRKVKPKYRAAVIAISKANKMAASKKEPDDDGW